MARLSIRERLAGTRLPFTGWLLVGLALRACLLPFALHPDMLRVYDRIRQWNDGDFTLSDFSFQALPMALHGLWAKVSGVALPNMRDVPWPDATLEQLYDWVVVALDSPAILGTIAAWKLPYLVADIVCALLIVRIVPERRRLATFALWMLHPIVLYVGMCFGKYEAFMVVPLLLGLGDLRRGKIERGFVWIGVASAMRLYPALIILPMVLAAAPEARRRWELLACAGAPAICIIGASALGGLWAWFALPLAFFAAWRLYERVRRTRIEAAFGGLVAVALVVLLFQLGGVLTNPRYEASTVLHHATYFTRITIGTNDKDPILMFGLVYALVCVWAHRASLGRPTATARERFGDVGDAALLAVLSFFAFSYFHPQYTMLLVPFVLLRLHRTDEGLIAHGLQTVGLLLFLFASKEGSTTTWLFAPLAPFELLAAPGPKETFPQLMEDLGWGGVGRTLLVVGSIWMAWEVLRSRGNERRDRDPVAGASASSLVLVALAFVVWPVGLFAAASFGMQAEVIRPVAPVYRTDERWLPGRPFKYFQFTTKRGIPDAISIRPPSGVEVAEGLGYDLTLSVAGRTGEAAEVETHWISAEELRPDARGDILIDLDLFELQPDRFYRMSIQPQREGELPFTLARLVERIPRGALRARVGATARDRLERAGFMGWPWIYLCGFVAVLGAGCVVVGTRRGRATG